MSRDGHEPYPFAIFAPSREASVIFFAVRWGPRPQRHGASAPSLRSGPRGVIFFVLLTLRVLRAFA
jgi:hypothetical protein